MSGGCVGEPVSWPRLERFAANAVGDAAIAAHLAACAACAACLAEIRADGVVLPPLVVPAAVPVRRRRWVGAAGVAGFAAAAAVVLVLALRPGDPEAPREELARVKGVGDVTLALVRERAGSIRTDVRTYAPGDRWKVVVTCPPAASAWVAVEVHDPAGVDRPLAASQLACGNRVALPGAFSITGAAANRVCARISAAPGAPAAVACVTLQPE